MKKNMLRTSKQMRGGQKAKEKEGGARIGVYICHCGTNISSVVDVYDLEKFSLSLPHVSVVRTYPYMCSYQGQNMIIEDIKAKKLNRVVVAACSPRMHEQTFRACCERAGLNPYLFEQVNIREQCSWVHEDAAKATEKAKSLIRAAVARASLLEPLEKRKIAVIQKVLVIGGGIAGITASLDLAEMGFHVYLVEKEPSIGGHMAQLDKTFPTLDCSACILTPKMSEVEHHENITLITNAEVESVEGYVGNFHVRIRVKCRFVSAEKCRGCITECEEHCPVYARSEFDAGLRRRKAIYIPFPQAVPLVARIDDAICIGCRLCELACPFDAIDFFCKDKFIDVDVGAIIVATGFKPYDVRNSAEFSKNSASTANAKSANLNIPASTADSTLTADFASTNYKNFATKTNQYGYGKFKNVITALEFERLSSASGPTGGKIVINGNPPKDVVFISCVGSRQRHGNKYCSRVCCMFTAKHAFIVKERIPDANVTVLYTDVRAYGDGFEEFYQRVREKGVVYLHRELDDIVEVTESACGAHSENERNDAEINATESENESGKLVVRVRRGDALLYEIPADLVVLATGLEPSEGTRRIAEILGIQCSSDGFLMEAHPKLRPVETLTDGIFIAGCCQSPKDIQDTVSQASAAASKCAELLASGCIEMEPAVAFVDERACTGCGICVSVCPFRALRMEKANAKAVKLHNALESGEKHATVARVDELRCKGCGSCAAACPAGAISVRHYNEKQMLAQIDALCH